MGRHRNFMLKEQTRITCLEYTSFVPPRKLTCERRLDFAIYGTGAPVCASWVSARRRHHSSDLLSSTLHSFLPFNLILQWNTKPSTLLSLLSIHFCDQRFEFRVRNIRIRSLFVVGDTGKNSIFECQLILDFLAGEVQAGSLSAGHFL